MSVLLTLAAVVVLGGGGLYFAVSGGAYLKTYLEIARAEPTPVRQLTDQSETVEIAGTARVHERTNRSPFTNTETLVHEWEINEISGGDSDREVDGEEKSPFLLEDDTGTVLVDPDGATLQLKQTTEIEVGPDETPPELVDGFFDSFDTWSADSSFSRFFRESRLHPGDEVHVYGPVREVGHSVDMPGGVTAVIGATELEDGPVDVTEITLSGVMERTRNDLVRWFVITKGSETAAATELRNKGLGWLAFGGVLMAIPVGMVLFP